MSIASEMVESSYPSECCTSIGARCSLSGITGSSGTSTTLGLGTASTVAGDATLLSSGSAGVRIARLLDFLRSAGVPPCRIRSDRQTTSLTLTTGVCEAGTKMRGASNMNIHYDVTGLLTAA